MVFLIPLSNHEQYLEEKPKFDVLVRGAHFQMERWGHTFP